MRETMPWERQKGESHQAFAAFHEYCLLGGKRSLRKTAQSLGKSETLLSTWSSKWKWVERAREYDNEIVRQDIQQARDEIAEMRKRQIEIGKYFQSKGVDAIKQKVKDEDKLKFEELRDLMNLVAKGMQMETDARLDGLVDMTGAQATHSDRDITVEKRMELEAYFDAE